MHAHASVLLHEAVAGLSLSRGDTVVDATLGLGGHTEALAHAVGDTGVVIGIDADHEAIHKAKERLAGVGTTVHFVHGNFRDITAHLQRIGMSEVNGILFDLGWNATQLTSGRGFSFRANEPLVMTLDATPHEDAVTARSIVNEWSEEDLADIIRTLGEERFAGRIAHAIAVRRRSAPIEKADELAEIVASSVPAFYRNGRTHPATKTFQALRMMVNDELTSLTAALEQSFALLASGGRIAVITFHSLEDGLVKRIFKKFVQEDRATLVTKKPTIPSREEIIKNPRARSAKLRIITKL